MFSNELVAEARDYGCSVIAFENSTDIRERTGASWGHKGAFNRLYEYVEYEAAEHGIEVEQVAPVNTSRGVRRADSHTLTTATAKISSVRNAATRTTPITARSPDYVRRVAKSRSDFVTVKKHRTAVSPSQLKLGAIEACSKNRRFSACH